MQTGTLRAKVPHCSSLPHPLFHRSLSGLALLSSSVGLEENWLPHLLGLYEQGCLGRPSWRGNRVLFKAQCAALLDLGLQLELDLQEGEMGLYFLSRTQGQLCSLPDPPDKLSKSIISTRTACSGGSPQHVGAQVGDGHYSMANLCGVTVLPVITPFNNMDSSSQVYMKHRPRAS